MQGSLILCLGSFTVAVPRRSFPRSSPSSATSTSTSATRPSPHTPPAIRMKPLRFQRAIS
ncbi:hypothetical protein E2C01_002666 [Portunus trituberculatus]|uniref:Uncharacterized protein n=1 Tax=Portunus trituberculatus TaxID=210409 RepID=A0A5B7CMK0_PORTR|nr:hypothetical protein [Portunus trituberculatus]